MPAAKRTRREPTDDWQQLQLRTRFPEQLTNALIRPVVLFGHSPAERARFTGTPDQSPQPPLWNLTADDWLTVITVAPYAPRRPRNDDDALQPHLFPEDMIDEAS